MVNSYRTLLADGSIQVSNRPQSASSRSRIETGGCSPDVKVYGNTLYDGDILAAQAAGAAATSQYIPVPQPPASPVAGAGQKFQQQRAMAAQKRLERLQLNGLAQSNDGIAMVSLNMGNSSSSSSRPGTPGTSRLPISAGGCTPAAAASGSGSWAQSSPAAASAAVSTQGGLASNSSSARMQGMQWPHSSGGLQELAATSGSAGGGLAGPGMMRPSSAAEKGLLAKGLATVYDPTLDSETGLIEIEAGDAMQLRPGSSRRETRGVPTAALDLSCMAAFLVAPGPRNAPVQCFIERDKGGMGRSPCYRMFLDDGRRFLLAARKRKKAASTIYVISSSADDISRHNNCYLGKLASNFIGTEFRIVSAATGKRSQTRGQQQQQQQLPATLSSRGTLMLASSTTAAQQSGSSISGGSSSGRAAGGSSGGSSFVQSYSGAVGEAHKIEVGAVLYQTNVMGTRGPRKMAVALPSVGPDGVSLWRSSGPDDTLLERLKSGSPSAGLVHLCNKTPRWNNALHAYCLNFRGRVTEASVKNFQLAADTDPDTVVLQFGKISDTCFTCDYMWPLSPLQAFCVCVSSLDDKLACE